MFSLGDTITCINDSRLGPDLLACPLRMGMDYRVQAMKLCKCGQVYVDIGLSLSSDHYDVVCDACSRRFNDGIWWFDANRFAKKRTTQATARKAKPAYQGGNLN